MRKIVNQNFSDRVEEEEKKEQIVEARPAPNHYSARLIYAQLIN